MSILRRSAAVVAGFAVASGVALAAAPAASADYPRPPGFQGCEMTTSPKEGVQGLLWGAAYGPSGSQNVFTHCWPYEWPYGQWTSAGSGG